MGGTMGSSSNGANTGTGATGTAGTTGTAGDPPATETTNDTSDTDAAAGGTPRLFIGSGTFACPGAPGAITVMSVDAGTGLPTDPVATPSGCLTSYIAFDTAAARLYAADEAGGRLLSFSVNRATGVLSPLGDIDAIGNPVYVALSPSSDYLLVAYFNQGRVASFSVGPDGALVERVDVEEIGAMARSHATVFDPSGQFVFVPNRDADAITQLTFDASTGQLELNPAAASLALTGGPRHMVFHPTGPWAYVVHELSGAVSLLELDSATGVLAVSDTLPGFQSTAAADIHVHPGGAYLYASDRTTNTIGIFAIDPSTGALEDLGRASTEGETPRNFGLDPTGRWLYAANQNTGNLAVFAIDPSSGGLTLQTQVDLGVDPYFVDWVEY